MNQNNFIKISIITIVYNNVKNIERTIKSVLSQNYPNIEYIVVDGGSTDGSVEVIQRYQNRIHKFISEHDNGIYDALNKGVISSSGDFITILHSDDIFFDSSTVYKVAKCIKKTNKEFYFSDMLIIDLASNKVKRYYDASIFKQWMFRIGWMPPHPTCFIKKSLFNEYGLYSLKYKIAGDFDLFVRFFYEKKIQWSYCNIITVKMSYGGVSNSGWHSKRLIFNEINNSLKENNVFSLPVFQFTRYLIRFIEILKAYKYNGKRI
jgi:glycosyltransferase involved in cell wall biosynthesis